MIEAGEKIAEAVQMMIDGGIIDLHHTIDGIGDPLEIPDRPPVRTAEEFERAMGRGKRESQG
jgi:hypothetical protein